MNSLVSSPRQASGNRLRENIQDFEPLRLFNSQRFANSHRSGTGHRVVRDTRTNLTGMTVGDPIPICREYKLLRANPQSRACAAILGETIFGPVIEVHVVQVFGTQGLEIEIPSPNNLKRTSWGSDIQRKESHTLTSAELLSEQKKRKKVHIAWRNRRLALRKLVRPLILAPGNWMRTLSVFLPAQCSAHKESYTRRNGNGTLFQLIHRTKEDLLQQGSPKMVTRSVRHSVQEERQSDAAVHWDQTRPKLLRV